MMDSDMIFKRKTTGTNAPSTGVLHDGAASHMGNSVVTGAAAGLMYLVTVNDSP